MDKFLLSLLDDPDMRDAVATLCEWLIDTNGYIKDMYPSNDLPSLIRRANDSTVRDNIGRVFKTVQGSITTLPTTMKYLSGPRILRILSKLTLNM